MEKLYVPKFKDDEFFSKEFLLGQSLDEYSENIGYFRRKRAKHLSFRLFTNMESEEFRQLSKRCDPSKLWTKSISSPCLPDEGYNPQFSLYDVPPVTTDLEIMKFTKQEEKRRCRKKNPHQVPYEAELPGSVNTKYRGETEVDYRARQATDQERCKDLVTRVDGLVCIQVRSLDEERDYIVTQEFLVPLHSTLSALRDRILCREDFQPAYPTSMSRKLEDNKYGMFYIGNTFYIDGRWGDNIFSDYSKTVISWAQGRNLSIGDKVNKMEETRIGQLAVRFGYLYLFQHQGSCQHHIVFTDARLVNDSDLPYLPDYPLLKSFANLSGKYCCVCTGRIAKWIVSECEIIPFEHTFFCNWCYFHYLHDQQGNKKSHFVAYKYVDRNALL